MSWIQESAKSGAKLRKHYKMHDIEIFIKDDLPKMIDVDFVFKYIASAIPSFLLSDIDVVYIGEFEHLTKRHISAIYEDGAIYVTNQQDSEMDFIDDIIHEVAHSVEKRHVELIYGDNGIQNEFKSKRQKLYDVLKSKGRNPPMEMITNFSYSPTLDNYFYTEITYPVLDQICTFEKLFVGPYSATSVREYFASNFERYFLGENMLVRNFSPVVFFKIKALLELEEQ